jgi:hypothetical protein
MKLTINMVVCLLLLLCLAAIQAAAGEPYRQVIALAANTNGATSAATTLALPQYKTACKISHILYSTGAGVTNTFKVVTGTITNTIGTKATSATDKLQSVTNELWLFKANDLVELSSSATNASSAILVGEVQ